MSVVSLDELTQVAKKFAASLQGGEVVLLEGELGAGKTTFVQAVCRALGVESTVTSPTFAIMNLYKGSAFKVVHLDLYRLKSAQEVASFGLEEYLNQPGIVTFIEWPDAVEGVRWNATHHIQLLTRSLDTRDISIDGE
jgi:tRNA threonylcarbamoyladenosine biosynthesis protein TsaE